MCSYKTTYSCDQCDYKATWMISLQAHIEYVHSNVTYTCDHCGYLSLIRQLKETLFIPIGIIAASVTWKEY